MFKKLNKKEFELLPEKEKMARLTYANRFKTFMVSIGAYKARDIRDIIADMLKTPYDEGSVSQILSGLMPVPQKIILGLSSSYKLNKDWLLTGEGETLKSENRDDNKQPNMEDKKSESAPSQLDLALMLHNYIEAGKIRAEAERINNLAILEQSSSIKMLTEMITSSTKGVAEEIGSVADNHHALLRLCTKHFAKLLGIDEETVLSEYRTGVASEVQKARSMDRMEGGTKQN